MKLLSTFAVCILCLLQPLKSIGAIRDTILTNIKNYTKEQFLKEYGKDETSEKIIDFYFQQYKKTKTRIYVFTTLTLGSTAFAVYGLTPPLYFYSFASGLIAAFFAIAFFYGVIEAIINRNK